MGIHTSRGGFENSGLRNAALVKITSGGSVMDDRGPWTGHLAKPAQLDKKRFDLEWIVPLEQGCPPMSRYTMSMRSTSRCRCWSGRR